MTYVHRRSDRQREDKYRRDLERSKSIRSREWDHPLGSIQAPLRRDAFVLPSEQKRWRWSDEAETFIEIPNVPVDMSWQKDYPHLLAPIGGDQWRASKND